MYVIPFYVRYLHFFGVIKSTTKAIHAFKYGRGVLRISHILVSRSQYLAVSDLQKKLDPIAPHSKRTTCIVAIQGHQLPPGIEPESPVKFRSGLLTSGF